MNVLIVEDHDLNRKLLRARLEDEQVIVHETINGLEALSFLEAHDVDAVISDILMPKMDGYELCRRVRQDRRYDTIPFIFYTSTYTDLEDEKFASDLGANGFMRKPSQADLILKKIQSSQELLLRATPYKSLPAEEHILREYNERLISKLEKKNIELYERTEKLRFQASMLDQVRNSVIATDLDGRIMYWNKYSEIYHQWTAEEVIGKHIVDVIIPSQQVNVFKDIINKTVFEGYWEGETLALRKDGSTFHVQLIVTSLTDSVGNPLGTVGVSIDITDRKQSEEALRESEEMFRQLTDAIREVFWLTDTKKNTMLYVSPGYEKIWERTCQSLIANPQSWLDSIHEEDRDRISRSAVTKQIHGDYNEEYRILLPDGRVRWIHDKAFPITTKSGETYRIAGIAEDITGRKQTEEQLKYSEEKYRDIVTWAPLGIYQTLPDGTFITVNRGIVEMLGYESEEELIQTNIADIYLQSNDREELIKKHEPSGWVSNVEVQWKKKDSTVIWVQVTTHSIKHETGEIKYYEGFVHDITTKKGLESQLIRVQRMESIGTLASGIAHDLNNVLAPISLAIELLKQRYPDSAGLNILGTLERSASRGANIVKQLLTYARGVEGARVHLQPKHLINEIESLIRQTFPKAITISTSINKNLPGIYGDATQLHQVLMNLCVNARDAMPRDGTISITATRFDFDSKNVNMHVDAKEGAYVLITVTDTGIGIPTDEINKIFDPFFTTKEIGKGTGLGLSIVLGIVKSHGGFVNVTSDVGKGTRFQIYLPAIATELVDQQNPTNQQLSKGAGELILVVDDEESILDITKKMLEVYGFQVIVAHDGIDAIAKFVENIQSVQLVITDAMMPNLDGPSTIRALRKINPELKVILSTGYAENIDAKSLTQLNVQAKLMKPYTTTELLNTIHRLL